MHLKMILVYQEAPAFIRFIHIVRMTRNFIAPEHKRQVPIYIEKKTILELTTSVYFQQIYCGKLRYGTTSIEPEILML